MPIGLEGAGVIRELGCQIREEIRLFATAAVASLTVREAVPPDANSLAR